MHENQAFPRYLSAAALLGFCGQMSLVPASLLRTRVPLLLEKMGLLDRAHEPIARFSKGMVQRLALAQALIAEPDLLVLDEPMEGLDLDARQLLQEIIEEQRSAGKAVLFVSHALGEVARVCDRLAVLVEGRLAYLGSLASLICDPETGGDANSRGGIWGQFIDLDGSVPWTCVAPWAVLKQLIQDTFRQGLASGICWMMLAVTAICAVFCLSVNVSGDVSLHSDSEPVFFLPDPTAQPVVPSARRDYEARLPRPTGSRAGATRGSRDDQRPDDPGVWCHFLSSEPRAKRCCPFPAVDPG